MADQPGVIYDWIRAGEVEEALKIEQQGVKQVFP
jgi:hypothetical protein